MLGPTLTLKSICHEQLSEHRGLDDILRLKYYIVHFMDCLLVSARTHKYSSKPRQSSKCPPEYCWKIYLSQRGYGIQTHNPWPWGSPPQITSPGQIAFGVLGISKTTNITRSRPLRNLLGVKASLSKHAFSALPFRQILLGVRVDPNKHAFRSHPKSPKLIRC